MTANVITAPTTRALSMGVGFRNPTSTVSSNASAPKTAPAATAQMTNSGPACDVVRTRITPLAMPGTTATISIDTGSTETARVLAGPPIARPRAIAWSSPGEVNATANVAAAITSASWPLPAVLGPGRNDVAHRQQCRRQSDAEQVEVGVVHQDSPNESRRRGRVGGHLHILQAPRPVQQRSAAEGVRLTGRSAAALHSGPKRWSPYDHDPQRPPRSPASGQAPGR